MNSRGGITLGHRPRDINRDDVHHAVDAARNISLPEDRVVLHVLPQEFLLDAHDNIRDPLGMIGGRLEVNVHLVTSSASAMQNLVIAINQAGVEVADTVLEPLASAESCLTQDERELGCCLLDIGGGTTELVVLGNGMLRHAAAIPVGGDHFTNDLAVGLRTPIPEAEKIKRDHGCVYQDLILEDEAIEIASVGDRPIAHGVYAHAERNRRAASAGTAVAGARRTATRRIHLPDSRGPRADGRRLESQRPRGTGRKHVPPAGSRSDTAGARGHARTALPS